MYKIQVADSDGKSFFCSDSENLLAAARRQGVKIAAGCRSGGCGMCKIRIMKGEFSRGLCSKAVLTDEERTRNYTLACKTYPKGDIELVIGI